MTRGALQAWENWHGLLTSVPSFPGRLRAVNFAAAATSWLRGSKRSVELWKAAPFHVDLADRIQRQMWAGCYEQHVTRAIAALLRPGSVFIDIGANIGYHSYFAAGLVGPSGGVHCFEPDPDVYQRLVGNLSSFSWAHAQNAAVWDSGATLQFERSFDAAESGWGALTAVRDFNRGQHISVQAIALDEWNRVQQLSALDMIKLDAEGAELHVIAGAKSTLQRFQPAILIEVSAPLLIQGGSSPSELISELNQLGYSLFTLDESRISPYAPIPDYHVVDCICVDAKRETNLLRDLAHAGFRS